LNINVFVNGVRMINMDLFQIQNVQLMENKQKNLLKKVLILMEFPIMHQIRTRRKKMYRHTINLVCNGGYWYIELPFNAGNIDLGDFNSKKLLICQMI